MGGLHFPESRILTGYTQSATVAFEGCVWCQRNPRCVFRHRRVAHPHVDWGGEMISFDPTLESLCLNLSLEDADDLRQERAGILEHEAGLTRAEAEQRAGLDPSSRSHTPLPGIETKGVHP